MSDPKRTVIKNIGLVLSGNIRNPILDIDTIVIENGLIAELSKISEITIGDNDRIIDANGSAVSPGLIDNHVHPVAGDWTPRQNQIGWIDSTVHGGVTTIISAGESHYPGRPNDVVGVKALGIASQRAFSNFRPTGMKILAG